MYIVNMLQLLLYIHTRKTHNYFSYILIATSYCIILIIVTFGFEQICNLHCVSRSKDAINYKMLTII